MFGNLQKFSEMFGNVRVTFGQVLENLQKFLESGRKSLENRQMPLEHKIHIFSRQHVAIGVNVVIVLEPS